jgi:hypothetical protein
MKLETATKGFRVINSGSHPHAREYHSRRRLLMAGRG